MQGEVIEDITEIIKDIDLLDLTIGLHLKEKVELLQVLSKRKILF